MNEQAAADKAMRELPEEEDHANAATQKKKHPKAQKERLKKPVEEDEMHNVDSTETGGSESERELSEEMEAGAPSDAYCFIPEEEAIRASHDCKLAHLRKQTRTKKKNEEEEKAAKTTPSSTVAAHENEAVDPAWTTVQKRVHYHIITCSLRWKASHLHHRTQFDSTL